MTNVRSALGPSDMGGRAKRLGLTVLQYGLLVGALAWIVSQTDWSRMVALLGRIDLPVLVAILFVTGVEFVTRFSMWYALLNGRHRTRFLTTARIDLVIKYVNHLVPSRVAGQSLAPFALYHYTDHDWTESLSIAGLNMGLHTSLYGVVAATGLVLFADRLSHGILVVLGFSAGLYVAIGTAVLVAGRELDLTAGVFAGTAGWLSGLPVIGDRLGGLFGRLPSFTADSAAIFRDLSADPQVLARYAVGWAGTLMIAPGVRTWLLLTALGGDFTPVVLLPVVLVTAYSVTLLPLTPGGVGVAEASATVVFVALGVPEAVAVPVVLADRFLGVYLPALLGWFPMLELDLSELVADRGPPAETPTSPED